MYCKELNADGFGFCWNFAEILMKVGFSRNISLSSSHRIL